MGNLIAIIVVSLNILSLGFQCYKVSDSRFKVLNLIISILMILSIIDYTYFNIIFQRVG